MRRHFEKAPVWIDHSIDGSVTPFKALPLRTPSCYLVYHRTYVASRAGGRIALWHGGTRRGYGMEGRRRTGRLPGSILATSRRTSLGRTSGGSSGGGVPLA